MTQAPLHRSETNGVAEMAVHRVTEGTAVALVQSGHLFYDKMADSKTPHQKRYGKEFDGPLIPFGTLFGCVPITAKDKSRKDPPVWKENAERMIVGLCTTYYVREEQGWSGDSLVCIFRRFAGNRSHNENTLTLCSQRRLGFLFDSW